MTPSDDGLFSELMKRGVSRRSFLKFCAAMTGALAIPASYTPRIASALTAAPRIPIVWLRGQGCGGDGDALLRAAKPTVAELFLELASVDYAEAMMAATGAEADLALTEALEAHDGRYFAVVEGAVPVADDGVFGVTGGRVFRDVVREVCDGALATIAVGTCAFDGGLPAAAGGRTGAVGVGAVVGTDRLVNLPGCPVNAENLTATIVHYLTFDELPQRDMRGRPLFAYGGLVHNQCERRSHFEFGQFVLAWGDEAAQKGWCLYKMGCKGPETFANCPTIRYAEGASWPVKAGHGCIGCTMPAFWDTMSPFYQRLPAPIPFVPDLTIDQIGVAATTGVAALAAAHGAASYARQRVLAAQGRRAAIAPPVPEQQPIVGASAALSAGGSLTGEVRDVIEPATFALPGRDPAPVDESELLGATAEVGLAEGATSGLAGPSGPSEPPAPPEPSEPSETEPSETEPSEAEPSEAEPSEAEAR